MGRFNVERKPRLAGWPTTYQAQEAIRAERHRRVIAFANSPSHAWIEQKLSRLGCQWSRQAISGPVIFDFWNHFFGIGIFVDEDEPSVDALAIDERETTRRAIKILRIRAFDDEDARRAVFDILNTRAWNARRIPAGLNPIHLAGDVSSHTLQDAPLE